MSHGHKCGETPWIGRTVAVTVQWQIYPWILLGFNGKSSKRLGEWLCVRWDFLLWETSPSTRTFPSVQWDQQTFFLNCCLPKCSWRNCSHWQRAVDLSRESGTARWACITQGHSPFPKLFPQQRGAQIVPHRKSNSNIIAAQQCFLTSTKRESSMTHCPQGGFSTHPCMSNAQNCSGWGYLAEINALPGFQPRKGRESRHKQPKKGQAKANMKGQ